MVVVVVFLFSVQVTLNCNTKCLLQLINATSDPGNSSL